MPEQMMPHYDDWGSASTFPHFAVGWAHAMNTPFQWAKQVASHFGGTEMEWLFIGRMELNPKEKYDRSFLMSLILHQQF